MIQSEPHVQVRTVGKLNAQCSVAINSAHSGVVAMQTVNDRCLPANGTTSRLQIENHAQRNILQLNSGQQAATGIYTDIGITGTIQFTL